MKRATAAGSEDVQINPYAAPGAEVRDPPEAVGAPALWNPNAAANWSLLFTPAFGAWLHMRNWQALGEPAKAAAQRVWVAAVLLLVAVSTLGGVFVARPPGIVHLQDWTRGIDLILLLTWYFGWARGQARYVQATFGANYRRKGWARPLLAAVACIVGYVIVVGMLGFLYAYLSFRGVGVVRAPS